MTHRLFFVSALLAACGGGSKKPNPDAPPADAPKPIDAAPDAPPDAPVASVSGTLAITDVALVDPSSLAAPSGSCPTCPGGIGGGSVSFEFDNLADGHGGTVVAGTTNVNGCVVTKYDPTHVPHTQLDDGPITVSDSPVSSMSGLLKTVGPCVLTPALGGYACVSHNAASEAVTASTTGVPAGTVAYVFSTPFTGQNLVGSYLSVNGFTTNTSFNSGTAAFPVLGMANNTTLIVLNPAGSATGATEVGAAIQDTILNGFLPVPGQGAGDNGAADFLGTGGVRVQAAATTTWPALDVTLDVPGEGWTLSDPGDPTALPLTGTASAPLSFGCGTGSSCGDGTTSALKAMIISGRATKQSVAALAPFQMPTEVPGTDTWLEFQCVFVFASTAVLDTAAQQAIIDFAPTRVETRVINASLAQVTSGANTVNVIAGHAYVGHTTHP